MMEERKKIEFWNYLTTERDQPRPKGITMQRLAVVKPVAIQADDLWFDVIERHGANERTAREFYQSGGAAQAHSRANFWGAIREIIRQSEDKRKVCRDIKQKRHPN